MQAEKGLHATENRKRLKKESGNSTYANGETDRSNLKSSPRGSILRSRFFNHTTRETEPLEKSENYRKVISREIVCFKIMKLVYNNYIYTKTF